MFKFDKENNQFEDGVWMPFDGSEFLIAHSSSVKFQRALARLQQPHRKRIEAGTMDPEESKRIVCQAMAEGVLLNWRNVISSAGEPVDYNKARGTEALLKDPSFRDFVSEVSMAATNYVQTEVEELGKS